MPDLEFLFRILRLPVPRFLRTDPVYLDNKENNDTEFLVCGMEVWSVLFDQWRPVGISDSIYVFYSSEIIRDRNGIPEGIRGPE